ncbi:MAG TPA: trypsin-like serine protease [Acidimicrobiia bacterium]|nr:trypsin-like serine protease [Acidimicrobiia bacterium]
MPGVYLIGKADCSMSFLQRIRPLFSCTKIFYLSLATILLASSCGGAEEKPASTTETTAPPTTAEIVLEVSEEPESGALLSAAEIYAQVAPSIVYIDTPDGTGSGIVLSNGYVLTNAHVVSLHNYVRVWGADGDHFPVPVYSRDWSRDLALVGPLPSATATIDFAEPREMLPGEPVYLIGFPGEGEVAPVAAITAGLVSRMRSNACTGLDFIQTDALIAGGQSGGALIDGYGNLVGVSGLGGFTEANFGLVLSGANAITGLPALESGVLPLIGTPIGKATRQETTLAPIDDNKFLITIDQPGTSVEVTVAPGEFEDVWLDLTDLYGAMPITESQEGIIDYLYQDPREEDPDDFGAVEEDLIGYYTDLYYDGEETLYATLDPGTYLVWVGSLEDDYLDVTVTSSHPLLPMVDDEEPSQPLKLGSWTDGIIGHLTDIDRLEIDLVAGEAVRIRVDSLADPVMNVYYQNTLVASNDDSRSGLYGSAPEVRFTPAQTGTYEIDVSFYDNATDGYRVTAARADDENFCGNNWWPRQG